jgi:hypothetical protein
MLSTLFWLRSLADLSWRLKLATAQHLTQATWRCSYAMGRLHSNVSGSPPCSTAPLMTEPAVASSDASNIECTFERLPGGRGYVVRGRKWWSSGALDPRCNLAIVMGKVVDPSDDGSTKNGNNKRAAQTMLLVPMDAPGVTIVRPLTVFG